VSRHLILMFILTFLDWNIISSHYQLLVSKVVKFLLFGKISFIFPDDYSIIILSRNPNPKKPLLRLPPNLLRRVEMPLRQMMMTPIANPTSVKVSY